MRLCDTICNYFCYNDQYTTAIHYYFLKTRISKKNCVYMSITSSVRNFFFSRQKINFNNNLLILYLNAQLCSLNSFVECKIQGFLGMYFIQQYDKVFITVFDLLFHGKHKKALAEIDTIESSITTNGFTKLECVLLKSKIYNELWLHNIPKKALEEIFKNSQAVDSPFHRIEIFLTLLQIYIQSNDKEKSLDLLGKAENYLAELDTFSIDIQGSIQSYLSFLLGVYHLRITNELPKASSDLTDSLKGFILSDTNMGVIQAKFWLGECFFRQFDLEKALIYHTESIESAKPYENEFWIARNHFSLGKTYTEQEHWEQAINSFTISTDIYRKFDHVHLLTNSLIELVGSFFQVKDWQNVEKYLNERLTVAREHQFIADIISSYYWFAYYYEYVDDYEKAIQTYQEVFELLTKLNYLEEVPRCSAHISYLNALKDGLLSRNDWKDELRRSNKPWKIVFVCNGNVSRSPFAEFIAKKWLRTNHPELEKIINVESVGVLYRNKEITPLTRMYLLNENINEAEVSNHIPKYWEDYLEMCNQTSIFVTMTGEQSNILNFHFPGKAFMLSYVANGTFKSIIDPAFHRIEAKELYTNLKSLTISFLEKMYQMLSEEK